MQEAHKLDPSLPNVSLDGLDLAALIASRICHDVISPVGAINNGIEVLEDEQDDDMRKIAMELVKKSARQASAKLQFCRLAFGAAGSAGAEIDTGDAETVARGLVEGEKVSLEWSGARVLLPKNMVKLILNLVLVAQGCIPRGGKLTVALPATPQAPFTLQAQGPHARVAPHLIDLLAGRAAGSVDSHAIQPFYTGLVARACGLGVSVTHVDEVVTLKVGPA